MDIVTYALAKKYTDNAIESLPKPMTYKGNKQTVNQLPLSGNTLGDVYTVSDTGLEYVWTKEAASGQLSDWEALSPNVLSVNGKTGEVTLNADDISDINTEHLFVSVDEKLEWSGKQDAIDANHMLDADLVDDTTSEHKFVTEADAAAWYAKQDALVSGTNIKTVHNNSLLGSGNIEIPTYSPFKSTWRTDTIAHLMTDIAADSDVVVGASYLGEVDNMTKAEGLFNGNGEIVVNVMRSHLYWCIVTSNNVDPYHWEATFSHSTISAKGWTPFVPGSRTIAGIDLKDDITAAELQTALVDSTHNFVTDSEKLEWSGKQDALTAGTGVSIENNVISCTASSTIGYEEVIG